MIAKKIKAVVMGDLNLIRCLGREKVPVIFAYAGEGKNPECLSNYCEKVISIRDPLKFPEKTVDDLINIGKSLEEKAVLYYEWDEHLILVSRNRRKLSEYYHFILPDEDLVETLVDKSKFARLVKEHGFPTPRTVLREELSDWKDVDNYLTLPCVLKTSCRINWFGSKVISSLGGIPQKVLKASTREDLRRYFDIMSNYDPNFIIQEYIPGGEDLIFSFHAYYNKLSQPASHFVGKKVRTFPKDCGISTFLELVYEPEVVRLGLEILETLNFKGVVKIDFKRNARDGTLSLLEINPRFNLWHYLGLYSGINLPYIVYNDLLGNNGSVSTIYKTNIKWVSLENDVHAFKEYQRNGDLNLKSWLKSLCTPKVYDVFSWRDPLPFVYRVTQFLWNRIRKLF